MFAAVSYFYLKLNFSDDSADVDKKDYTVPYEKMPENSGVAFVLPNNSAVLVYLDFENVCMQILNIEKFGIQTEYYGYTADYTVELSYELIGGIIDRVGGINLEIDGEILRYTGVQVIDLISSGKASMIKQQLITQIFEQISKNKFSREDFVYIIEKSKSDLSIIDCIYWLEYIDDISGRVNFVN